MLIPLVKTKKRYWRRYAGLLARSAVFRIVDGTADSVLRQRIATTVLRIIKTPDDNSKGRAEPDDSLPSLN